MPIIEGNVNENNWFPGEIELISILEGHEGSINSVRFNNTGDYCMTCSQDKSVILWNPHKRLIIKKYKGAHNHGINDISIYEDNSKFISAGGDTSAFLWDVSEAKVIRKFIGHTHKLECCKLNISCNILCTGSYDKTIRLWDLKSSNKNPIQILSDATDSISSLNVTENEILSACVDGNVRCYDIRMGRIYCDNYQNPLTSVNLSRDKSCVLVSCLDQSIYLSEKITGDIVGVYKGHTHTKYKISSILSPYDECIVSGSEDHKIFMWDLLKGTSKNTHNSHNTSVANESTSYATSIKAHEDIVVDIQFHPDKNIMLSVSADKTLKVWANTRSK